MEDATKLKVDDQKDLKDLVDPQHKQDVATKVEVEKNGVVGEHTEAVIYHE